MDERLILPATGEPRKRPPDTADEADAQALDRAVENMIQQVLSEWNHSRSLGSLNRADLHRLANAAICGWILERAEMAKCGNEKVRDELNFDAGFAMQTLDGIHGSAPLPISIPRAAATPRRKGKRA